MASDPLASAWQAVQRQQRLACRQDSDCHTLPLGHRACGGPESYLAWSAAPGEGSDAAALAAATRRYTALRRKQAQALGEMSTCEVKADPGAFCSWASPPAAGGATSPANWGQCTLHAPGGGAR
jgi:hypothetical protein